MSITAHIQNLEKRHALLENLIESEATRPLPDFVKVTQLKKQRLRIKEQLQQVYGKPAAA